MALPGIGEAAMDDTGDERSGDVRGEAGEDQAADFSLNVPLLFPFGILPADQADQIIDIWWKTMANAARLEKLEQQVPQLQQQVQQLAQQIAKIDEHVLNIGRQTLFHGRPTNMMIADICTHLEFDPLTGLPTH